MNSVDAAGVLYESDRKFQVWTWAVGHSMLHLRSNPSANDSTRIEIVFTPVILVCLAFTCDGLAISAVPHGALPQVLQATLGRTLREYETVYSIRSRATQAWVVAGGASGREDDQSWDAPLLFDGWKPRPGVRELFMYPDHGK